MGSIYIFFNCVIHSKRKGRSMYRDAVVIADTQCEEGDNDPASTKGGRDTEVKFDESKTQEAHNDPDSDDLLGEAI